MNAPLPTTPYSPDATAFAEERMPTFEGENAASKRRYLTYRVFDFDKHEACRLTGINIKTYHRWCAQDPVFKAWEELELVQFRKDLQVQATTGQFYRNMWTALELDKIVLTKALIEGIDKLSQQEHQYLMRIRQRYGMDSLINMLRVANGDLAITGGNVLINTVFVAGPGGEPVEVKTDAAD